MLVLKPFSQTSLISEADAVISGVQDYQVAGLVLAFLQHGDHFGTLGHLGQPMKLQTVLFGGVGFLEICGVVSEQRLFF